MIASGFKFVSLTFQIAFAGFFVAQCELPTFDDGGASLFTSATLAPFSCAVRQENDDLDPRLVDFDISGLIRFKTAKQAEERRKKLIHFVWPKGLPATRPKVTKASPDIPELESLDARLIDTVEMYDVDCGRLDFHSLVYVVHPKRDEEESARLAIVFAGHMPEGKGNYLAAGLSDAANTLLKENFTVAVMQMPLVGWNHDTDGKLAGGSGFRIETRGTRGHDDLFSALEPKINGRVFTLFLEPVVQTINEWVSKERKKPTILMIGLSGGGWTTHMAAAIDTRIDISLPVAGSLPLYARPFSRGSRGDIEQWYSPLFGEMDSNDDGIPDKAKGVCSWLEIYALGAIAPEKNHRRKQIQVLNYYDSCCFGGPVYKSYAEQLSKRNAEINRGSWSLYSDDSHRGHVISSDVIDNVLLKVIEEENSKLMTEQPAFPTAEGYGARTIGGRGGKVIAVTNLNESGPGSFRAAIEAKGPRIVVFRVSGTIEGQFKIQNDFITIAGQTAPGDGICIKGTLTLAASEIIIRYLRVRPDPSVGSVDAITGWKERNIILDHLSTSWSSDEILSLYRNEYVTIQCCMITEACAKILEGKNTGHRFGGIWGNNYGTYHHNLFAHNDSRNPRWARGTRLNDFRNNVLYNWGYNSSYGGEAVDDRSPETKFFTLNMVANYFKPGPATQKKVKHRFVKPLSNTGGAGSWYIAENFMKGAETVTADNWLGVSGKEFKKLTKPWTAMPINQESAQDAFESVLADVGCNFPRRDKIDRRIVEEVRTGTARYGKKGIITSPEDVGGWPELQSNLAPQDSDNDGMPDAWETKNGLDPQNSQDGKSDRDGDGYTNVEEYLNGLVADSNEQGESTGKDGRLKKRRDISVENRPPVKLKFEQLGSISGTERWDWWQARTAHVPGKQPFFITTMSQTGKTGTHNFHDILQSISRDGGRTWSEPAIVPSLKRTSQSDGFEVAPGDLWPTFHAKTGKVIATGKTFNFENGKKEIRLREQVSYTVLNPSTGKWGPLRFLDVPDRDRSGATITAANAGCNQRVDLPNGDVLLPVRYWRDPKTHQYTSTVMRCGFDGESLTYQTHGSEHTIAKGRGLYEPSLVQFDGQYFLTLRADHSAFVTRGTDGVNFEPVREWKFDNGDVLGSYNTQQHWVTVGDGLFLIYTRRGADNDHVMRHRAPLFIAQVNPETLRVIRATERILIDENHATLGNSGVCRVSEDESWVTCGEGLLRAGKRKGQLNKVFHVRITPE